MKHSYQHIRFRDLADLDRSMHKISMDIPPETGLIVGIPRSGLLAASIAALQLNLPLADLDGFLEGRTLASGKRTLRPTDGDRNRVLIVDDSVGSGSQIEEVRRRLASSGQPRPISFAAPYVTRHGAQLVDHFAEIVDPPRVFAWNLMHHDEILSRSCIDIDGVLCVDPTNDENDDGSKYEDFLMDAQPLYLPSVPVRYVVTSRLERYRSQTEAWLDRHGVTFERLVMLDLPDAEMRRRLGVHAHHKAAFYRESDSELFIESDFSQAAEIVALTGKQVFAIDVGKMVYPTPRLAFERAPREFARSVAYVPPAQALYQRIRRARDQVYRLGRRAKALKS